MGFVISLFAGTSGGWAYFPSSWGCPTPLAPPSAIFLSDLCASVAIPLLVSIREGFGVYAWDQLQGVLVVDLFQDLVGDLEAVDAPERVAAAVVLEIFVACFQRAKIPFVFVHLVNVFTHQHAVLILHQEIVRRIRLPAQLREHRGDTHVHVRERVEQWPHPLHTVPLTPHIPPDQIHLRLLPTQLLP